MECGLELDARKSFMTIFGHARKDGFPLTAYSGLRVLTNTILPKQMTLKTLDHAVESAVREAALAFVITGFHRFFESEYGGSGGGCTRDRFGGRGGHSCIRAGHGALGRNLAGFVIPDYYVEPTIEGG